MARTQRVSNANDPIAIPRIAEHTVLEISEFDGFTTQTAQPLYRALLNNSNCKRLTWNGVETPSAQFAAQLPRKFDDG